TLSQWIRASNMSITLTPPTSYRATLLLWSHYSCDRPTLPHLYLPAWAVTPQPTVSTATSNLPILPTASVNLVPLSAVATVERTTAPLAIMHEEQFPAVTLSFNLAPS